MCNKTPQSIGITGFALLQMCCRCVAVVADRVADRVADKFHLLQMLLQLTINGRCNNLQQVIFYHFFVFCCRKSATSATHLQQVQHDLQHIFIHKHSIFIHLQQYLQQFLIQFYYKLPFISVSCFCVSYPFSFKVICIFNFFVESFD